MNTPPAMVKGREARALVPVTLTIAAGRKHTAETILKAWSEGKTDNTLRSYQHDLADFAMFLSRGLAISPPLDVPTALDRFFRQAAPSAHEIVLAFRGYLASTRMAPASINRHLAALRSLSKLGRMLGICTWALEVPGLPAEQRRKTVGPQPETVRELLAATSGDTEGETRDYAIVLTFYCMGLRVSELCGLNLEETDLQRGTTWIKGKGRRERELVPVPRAVIDGLRRYLAHRGTRPGPLFRTRGEKGKRRDGRLETRSVGKIVRKLGAKIGLHLWCHALRHSSISAAIDAAGKAGIGLERVKSHSRHKTIQTLLVYHDEHDRTQTQRTLGELVAATLDAERKSDDENRGR